MIGKSLRERYAIGPLADDEAVAILNERLPADAAALVEVRAQGARMVACLIVRADRSAVQLCRAMGLEMTLGGNGVMGLVGADAARLFGPLSAHQRAWLETPCAARETKVLLVSGGIALLSLETTAGQVTVTPIAQTSAVN